MLCVRLGISRHPKLGDRRPGGVYDTNPQFWLTPLPPRQHLPDGPFVLELSHDKIHFFVFFQIFNSKFMVVHQIYIQVSSLDNTIAFIT